MLVRALARALEAFEYACALVEATPKAMQESTLEALDHLQTMIQLRAYLIDRRMLAASSHLKKWESTIEEARQMLTEIITEITHDGYRRVIVPTLTRALNEDFYEAMCEAFAAYGPAADFPATALRHAIATILYHWGIEKVSPTKQGSYTTIVAERLRRGVRTRPRARG